MRLMLPFLLWFLYAAALQAQVARPGAPTLPDDPPQATIDECIKIIRSPDIKYQQENGHKVTALFGCRNPQLRQQGIYFFVSHPSDDAEVVDALIKLIDTDRFQVDRQQAINVLSLQKNRPEILKVLSETEQRGFRTWSEQVFGRVSQSLKQPEYPDRTIQPAMDRYTQAMLGVINDPAAAPWARKDAFEMLCMDAPNTVLAFDEFVQPPLDDYTLAHDTTRALDLCLTSDRPFAQTTALADLKTGSPKVRGLLVDRLKKCNEHCAPIVAEMLKSPALRSDAIDIISTNGNLQGPLASNVVRLANDPSPATRLVVINFVAKARWNTESASVLATAMQDADQSVRLAAINASGNFSNSPAIAAALVTAVGSKDSTSRDAALSQMANITAHGNSFAFAGSAPGLRATLTPLLYDANPNTRANSRALWSNLRFGQPPPPPVPTAAIVVLGGIGALDFLLAIASLVGAIRSTMNEESTASQYGQEPFLTLESSRRISQAAGVLLMMAGAVYAAQALWAAADARQPVGLKDLPALLMFVFMLAVGSGTLFWGRAVANHNGRVFDLVMFHLIAGGTVLLALGALALTIIGLFATRELAGTLTSLVFEAVCAALLIWALASVWSGLARRPAAIPL